jgi:sulfur-oxidizing protein SoxY
MITSRRNFLKNTLSSAIVLITGTAVLSQRVLADWSKTAFAAKNPEEALMALFNNSDATVSDKITIVSPEIAENGKVVPVEVKVNLPQVESITLFSEKNPVPLVAQFNFKGRAKGWIKTRIKMAETGKVIAVVKANGKLFQASREIKVTVGGCGG